MQADRQIAVGCALAEDLAGERSAGVPRLARIAWGDFLVRVAVGVADGIVEALESGVSRGEA